MGMIKTFVASKELFHAKFRGWQNHRTNRNKYITRKRKKIGGQKNQS